MLEEHLEFCRRALTETLILARVAKSCVEDSISIIVKKDGPKFKNDLKFDIDIPHKGRIKVYNIDDLEFVISTNKSNLI